VRPSRPPRPTRRAGAHRLAPAAKRGDWLIDDGSALSALAALTLVNLAATVLIRQ
jgi:hypothetical protein